MQSVKKSQRKEKKHLRRRSNWYIYLTAFSATILLLTLFVFAIWDTLFPSNTTQLVSKSGMVNVAPSEELNTTILLTLSEVSGSVPDSFMLIDYRPREGVITLIPLNPATKVKVGVMGGGISDLYRKSGIRTVMAGIDETFGTNTEFYIQLDRIAFTKLISILGNVKVNVPFDFESDMFSITSGERFMSGDELFSYLKYADYPQAGEDYDLVMLALSVETLINTNGKNLESGVIQDAFNALTETSVTNLTFKDYTTYQKALVYTSQNSTNPATRCIPIGEYDGLEFIVSDESITEIKNRLE